MVVASATLELLGQFYALTPYCFVIAVGVSGLRGVRVER